MPKRNVLSVTPAIVAAAYGDGDVIGAVIEIPNMAVASGDALKLESVVVTDKADQKSDIDLVFFNEAPANSIGNDNAAYGLNDADILKLVGRVSIATADYISSGSNNAEASLRNLGLIMKPRANQTSLWVAVISRGTPTYASATDLNFRLGVEQG